MPRGTGPDRIPRRPRGRVPLLPAVCYLGVTVIIPLWNGGAARAQVWAHGGLVLGTVTISLAAVWLVAEWRSLRRARRRRVGERRAPAAACK